MEASYVWQWFAELVATTEISYSEIKAWSDMKGIKVRAWELSAIMRLEKMRNTK